MARSDRWHEGDVIVWFQTGSQPDARTDSDIYLSFYDAGGAAIGWVQAYERGDLNGFEVGEINCGFLGNTGKSPWLRLLQEKGSQLGVRIENVSDDEPNWFCERISLDFRLGPGERTMRHWAVDSWVEPASEEAVFQCEVGESDSTMVPLDGGFEKEVEIESGGANDRPLG